MMGDSVVSGGFRVSRGLSGRTRQPEEPKCKYTNNGGAGVTKPS